MSGDAPDPTAAPLLPGEPAQPAPADDTDLAARQNPDGTASHHPGTIVQTPAVARQLVKLLDPAAPPNRRGSLPEVPGYTLESELGAGGMGVVYRARDLALGRDVALKILQDRYPADSPAARRFLDEARITGQLQHPSIPRSTRSANCPAAGLSWR